MKEIANLMGFSNENTAKSKKYQCKKKLEIKVRALITEDERSV